MNIKMCGNGHILKHIPFFKIPFLKNYGIDLPLYVKIDLH